MTVPNRFQQVSVVLPYGQPDEKFHERLAALITERGGLPEQGTLELAKEVTEFLLGRPPEDRPAPHQVSTLVILDDVDMAVVPFGHCVVGRGKNNDWKVFLGRPLPMHVDLPIVENNEAKKPISLNFGTLEGGLRISVNDAFKAFDHYPSDFWEFVQKSLEAIPYEQFPKGLPTPREMVATFTAYFECNGLYQIMKADVSDVILSIRKPRTRYGLVTYNTSPFDRVMLPESYWCVQIKRKTQKEEQRVQH